MTKYGVCMDIHGDAYIQVEAEDKESAIRLAVELIDLEHIQDWGVDYRTADVEEISQTKGPQSNGN